MKGFFGNLLWGLIIFVWGGHFGASTIVYMERHSGRTFRERYILGLIATTIFLVTAGILTYRFAKKHNSKTPVKGALIVCSLLGMILAIGYLMVPFVL